MRMELELEIEERCWECVVYSYNILSIRYNVKVEI